MERWYRLVTSRRRDKLRELAECFHAFSRRRLTVLSWYRYGVNQGLDGRDSNGLVMGGACASSSRVSVELYDSTRSERGEGGLVMSGSDERSDLSLIHISEPTRRTPISYAVFCLKK